MLRQMPGKSTEQNETRLSEKRILTCRSMTVVRERTEQYIRRHSRHIGKAKLLPEA